MQPDTRNIDEIAKTLANGLSLEALRERQAPKFEMQPTTTENAATPEGAEYLRRLFAEPEKRQTVMVVRRVTQEMDYADARRKVWALLQMRAAHIETLDNRPFEWKFDEGEANIVRNLTRYFINDPACEWPLTKGLFLYGAPGTGKTELAQVFARFTEENFLSKQFYYSSLSEIYVRAKSDKDFDPVTPNVQFDRAFDEFGRHTGPVLRFGEPLDINEAIIEARYERQRRYGQITHFVANTTPNETQSAFSPMIYDRIRAMCTGVVFTGKSKRR